MNEKMLIDISDFNLSTLVIIKLVNRECSVGVMSGLVASYGPARYTNRTTN